MEESSLAQLLNPRLRITGKPVYEAPFPIVQVVRAWYPKLA